jgi:cytochrome c556
MKRTIIAAGLSLALAACVAWAQDHEEFEKWMKDTNANFGSLRKTVAAKDGPATAAAAEKLAGIFGEVKGHFEEHKMADGISFAQNAHEAAMSLASAAKAGDWDKASADLKTIGGACQGCHAAHREKLPDGSYKMK